MDPQTQPQNNNTPQQPNQPPQNGYPYQQPYGQPQNGYPYQQQPYGQPQNGYSYQQQPYGQPQNGYPLPAAALRTATKRLPLPAAALQTATKRLLLSAAALFPAGTAAQAGGRTCGKLFLFPAANAEFFRHTDLCFFCDDLPHDFRCPPAVLTATCRQSCRIMKASSIAAFRPPRHCRTCWQPSSLRSGIGSASGNHAPPYEKPHRS